MRRWMLLAAVMVLAVPALADLRVSDGSGERPVTRVSLDSLRGTRILRLDVDGDGVKDTLQLYYEMKTYRLTVGPVGEDACLASFEPGQDVHNYMDIATGYVAGAKKPALIVYFTRGLAGGDDLKVVDVLNTTMGREPRYLFDGDGGYADGPVLVTPGVIEIRDPNGNLDARYLWEGKRYNEQEGTGE